MEELQRKERDRREKKLFKQLEKQQKKLAAKGIHVDIETLKKDYETQRAGGKSTLNLDLLTASNDEIDVVGGIDDSFDDSETDAQVTRLQKMEFDNIKKKISPFSIESLLAKRQAAVAVAAVAASIKTEEENNNPPLTSSPIPTSCSSPLSRGSSPALSPSPVCTNSASQFFNPSGILGKFVDPAKISYSLATLQPEPPIPKNQDHEQVRTTSPNT